MMWARRIALGGVGGGLGLLFTDKQKECEACSLSTACCVLTTAAIGTVQALLYFQRELENEGRRLLAARADQGDGPAQLCMAGLAYSQISPEASIPLLRKCADNQPECKALYALLSSDADKTKRLEEAAKEVRQQFKTMGKPEDEVQVAPPPPPGYLPKPIGDEDAVELLMMVGADYIRSVLSAIAVRGFPAIDSSLTDSERASVHYISASRGFVPFFYNLGRNAQTGGKPEEAARLYVDLILSTPHHAMNVLESLGEDHTPTMTKEWREAKVTWWAAAVTSARVELCRLYTEQVNPFGFSDNDIQTNLQQAVESLPHLQDTLKSVFEKEDPFVERLAPTYESCKKASRGPMVPSRDLDLCAEGMRAFADHLFQHV